MEEIRRAVDSLTEKFLCLPLGIFTNSVDSFVQSNHLNQAPGKILVVSQKRGPVRSLEGID